MVKPLDELYFEWLYRQVGSVHERNPSRSYWRILSILYCKEFTWSIDLDGNRAEDGKDLRQEFIQEKSLINVDEAWLDLECSIFELLIGLSRRAAFEVEGEPAAWFWRLMENLEFDKYNDNTVIPVDEVDGILDALNNRQYNYDGSGGLFPLKNATRDQRKVEIWYQLNAYLLEQD